jgi:hypothetical protein
VRDVHSNVVRGEWIQQGGVILDPEYASAVELRSIAPSVWRGTVVPLDQRISVYLFISTKDGKTTATISNPEGNFFRRRIYSLIRDGANISLEANGQKVEGTWDEKNGTLSLQLVKWLPLFRFMHIGRQTMQWGFIRGLHRIRADGAIVLQCQMGMAGERLRCRRRA